MIMDKKEYLKNRFIKDFLQYSLLQEDSISAKEIADKLYGVVVLDPFIAQCKQKIESLIGKYLSFEKVTVEGKLSNTLSSDLDYDIKDRIVSEYKYALDSIPNENLVCDIVGSIVRCVELQTWSNGIVNMGKAISLLVGRLNDTSECYSGLYVAPVSENELQDKFKKAKENTFVERIQGNNIDDIIEYRNVLIEYVQVACENILYSKLEDIYSMIATNNVFVQLNDNFRYLSAYADELKRSVADYDVNPEWDREYNRMIPTDFYFRNVENITAEQAFHMVLLQFFAKNEDWMIENGMLENGELCVYTGKCQHALNNLLITVENSLI